MNAALMQCVILQCTGPSSNIEQREQQQHRISQIHFKSKSKFIQIKKKKLCLVLFVSSLPESQSPHSIGYKRSAKRTESIKCDENRV